MKNFKFKMAFLLCTLLLCGCQRKSEILNPIAPVKLAVTHGDGEHVILPMILPLSDKMIAGFDSPAEKINFLLGGFARIFMDFGTTLGLGKTHLTLVQPLPLNLTDSPLKGLKIKRVFFYIEPKDGVERIKSWFEAIIFGQRDVSFRFLRKIGAIISPFEAKGEFDSWTPKFEYKDLNNENEKVFKKIFDKNSYNYRNFTTGREKSVTLFNYRKRDLRSYLNNYFKSKVVMIKSEQAHKIKKILATGDFFPNVVKNSFVLNKTVLVELKNLENIDELFKNEFLNTISSNKEIILDSYERCNQKICLDLNVTDTDLMPLISNYNAVKIDAFVDAGSAPESFQLSGFIEFEVKIKMTF